MRELVTKVLLPLAVGCVARSFLISFRFSFDFHFALLSMCLCLPVSLCVSLCVCGIIYSLIITQASYYTCHLISPPQAYASQGFPWKFWKPLDSWSPRSLLQRLPIVQRKKIAQNAEFSGNSLIIHENRKSLKETLVLAKNWWKWSLRLKMMICDEMSTFPCTTH